LPKIYQKMLQEELTTASQPAAANAATPSPKINPKGKQPKPQ
jgi:hypothetical protein